MAWLKAPAFRMGPDRCRLHWGKERDTLASAKVSAREPG